MKIKYNPNKVIKSLTLVISLALTTSLYAGNGAWGDNSFRNNSKQNSSNSKYSNNNNSKNNKGPWKNNNKNNSKNYSKNNKDGKNHSKGKYCNNDSIPLDGGLSILLLGAAAFGIKKLRDNNND